MDNKQLFAAEALKDDHFSMGRIMASVDGSTVQSELHLMETGKFQILSFLALTLQRHYITK